MRKLALNGMIQAKVIPGRSRNETLVNPKQGLSSELIFAPTSSRQGT
jgi:hypothetical protein